MFEILELLLLLVFNSLVIWGWYIATSYDEEVMTEELKPQMGFIRKRELLIVDTNIFGFIKKWGDLHIPYWLTKPLYNCPPCMASIHSTYVYWFFMPFELHSLYIYPIYILALSGLNYIISEKISNA